MTGSTTTKSPARIYVAGESDDETVADVFARIRARGGQPAMMHRCLAAAPKVFEAVYNLAIALRHETSISRAIGELMILRTVQLEGGHYEFAAHKIIARQVGMNDDQIAALEVNWQESDLFSPEQRAVLAYADALADRADVPDDVFAALAAHFSDREIVEMTVTAGFYVQAARLSSGLKMHVEH